jgi:Uncharacterized alpha/beta hydrolase domain (DUF2235)
MSNTAFDPTYIANQRDEAPGPSNPVPNGQAAQSARRAPGQRALSDREREQRQIALAPTVPDKTEAMCGCTKVLHFTVFFDGTGNNRKQELAKPVEDRALSNIAKLFDAHKDGVSISQHYIPGVGTPYPEIGDTGGAIASAIGKGGDKRVKKALELLDKAIAETPAQQKIRLINVVVFGFSRGAAQARAFVRDLAAQCQPDDGAYTYKGVPLRVAFSGIYDTVCSAYDNLVQGVVSTKGGHNGWAKDMKLPPMVEQSVHMMAAHEARIRFPLDSTRIDAAYPDNTIEVWYPGVHSDVGGGYAPGYQGRNNTISRFSLNEMFDLAFAAGILFQRIEKLAPEIQDEFKKDDPDLREAFNAYLQAVPRKSGPLEEVQAAHMELLHRWLKVRVTTQTPTQGELKLQTQRDNAKTARDALRQKERRFSMAHGEGDATPLNLSSDEQLELAKLEEEGEKEHERYKEADGALEDLNQENRKYRKDIQAILEKHANKQPLSLRERTLKAAWENNNPLPPQVEKFFDLFAHDSIAHFNYDSSRLSDWRTIYFGDTKYSPS